MYVYFDKQRLKKKSIGQGTLYSYIENRWRYKYMRNMKGTYLGIEAYIHIEFYEVINKYDIQLAQNVFIEGKLDF